MEVDWEECALGELIAIKHGFAFQGEFFNDNAVGDILLTPGNFAVGGGFKGNKFKYYSGPVPADFVLEEGDLLVTMTDLSKQADTLGYPAFVPERPDNRCYLHNQRLGKIQIKDTNKLDLRYLHYLFCSPEYRHEILAGATGTTVKHTSPARILAYRFPRPSLVEQRAIAHVLGTLDDKIELNRRMSETLEEMARALFKSWFVDFEPVRAMAEGRDIGLPSDIADLFPDRFVDSELGEIPEGWEITAIDNLLELAYGKALKSADRRAGDIPVFGSNGQVGWHDKPLGQGPGIIVGRKGNPGTVKWAPGDFYVIDTAFYVVPKATCYSLRFLFHALQRQGLPSLGADSAVPGLNRNAASMNRQVLPPSALVEKFEVISRPLDERIHACSHASRTLAEVRDALLPKLTSGENRIKDPGSVLGITM